MEKYNPKKNEAKWQKYWEEHPELFEAREDAAAEKKFILDMFPYPSGAGLHVGHVESYTATDIFSRYLRMNGKNVLHPQGWDAFGLPAENYAIKTGTHPKITTQKAIANFKKQMKKMGFSYDWGRELNSSDPEYYRWTQWFFLLLYKNGLAYKAKAKVNWCDNCKTVLANEQAEGGICERCKNQVIQKDLEQWFFKITDFIENNGATSGLISGLDSVDWPESTKTAQKNWIGKSGGAIVKFKIQKSKIKINEESFYIEAFTTRLDTIHGCTYCVVAPEHSVIGELQREIENWSEVEKYLEETKRKTDLDRMEEKEKTGVLLKGIKTINPFTNEEIPVFVADYVLGHYGTGAVMGVPAHDTRDWEFAKKYNLPVVQVIKKHCIVPRSFLMGGESISDRELESIGVKILEKTPKGSRKLEMNQNCLEKYIFLVKEKLTPGFWNEIVGEEIKFIFKSKEGETKEFVLDKSNSSEIEKLGAQYNGEEYLGQTSTWKWLAENDLYTDLIIHTEDGILVNSGEYSGLTSEQARDKMAQWLEEKKLGERRVNYKLRDWLVSRQRYWGAPIPVIYCRKCLEIPNSQIPISKQISNPNVKNFQTATIDGVEYAIVPVSEKDLPVKLPDDVNFMPTGESPLKKSKTFHDVNCPVCGEKAFRESDTMDTFVCSSWYYFRYADPKNSSAFADREKIKKWLPVDLYVGGAEHSVLHLLYSRFFTKVLHKLGYIDFDEPFYKLRHQGIILAEDGRKMSKSLGNVINPDDVVAEYGADTLRLFEMFMGPLEDMKPWNTKSIMGARRFLERIWDFYQNFLNNFEKMRNWIGTREDEIMLNKTVKKVTEDIESMKFNTVISELMKYLNYMTGRKRGDGGMGAFNITHALIFAKLLYPLAPHISSELFQQIQHADKEKSGSSNIALESWPAYNAAMIAEEEVELVIQINGKLRDRVKVRADISEDEAKNMALGNEKIKKFLGEKEVRRVVFIGGRLINIVV